MVLQKQVLPQAYLDNQVRMKSALPKVALQEAKAIIKRWEADPVSKSFPDPVQLASANFFATSVVVSIVSLLTGLDTWQFWNLPDGGMTPNVRNPRDLQL
jgi:hypothetical protein